MYYSYSVFTSDIGYWRSCNRNGNTLDKKTDEIFILEGDMNFHIGNLNNYEEEFMEGTRNVNSVRNTLGKIFDKKVKFLYIF